MMKRRPLALRPVLAGACALTMAASAQAQDHLSLNGTWSFALARPAGRCTAARFARPDASADPRFVPTPVPSNWAMQGFEAPQYKRFSGDASGFYLRHITLPAAWSGRRMLLHFDGVWSSAEVWLNGKPLGRHDSGFTSFAYDVSSAMKPGADNVLPCACVRCSPITRWTPMTIGRWAGSTAMSG
jgi:beta-galactosidase